MRRETPFDYGEWLEEKLFTHCQRHVFFKYRDISARTKFNFIMSQIEKWNGKSSNDFVRLSDIIKTPAIQVDEERHYSVSRSFILADKNFWPIIRNFMFDDIKFSGAEFCKKNNLNFYEFKKNLNRVVEMAAVIAGWVK